MTLGSPRSCPFCGALVVWIAPYGRYDAEGQQGKHSCERPRVEIPRQVACIGCDRLIDITEGQRLNQDGSAHDCARDAAPALDRPRPETPVAVATPAAPEAPRARPPVTPSGEPPARWLLDE